jgi:hypothetical protein
VLTKQSGTLDDIKDPKTDSLGGYYQDWTFNSGCYSWYLWGVSGEASFSADKPCKYPAGSIEATFGCDQSIVTQVAHIDSI